MAVETTVAGVQVGLARPLVIAAVPVVVALLGVFLLRDRDGATFDRRTRTLVFAARVAVVVLLVVGAAGPYTADTRQTVGDPSVAMLVDRSASTSVTGNISGDLAAAIEDRGVDVSTRIVADGDRSPVGDVIANSLEANGSVLVVSDGQVTDGRSLSAAAGIARQVNTSIDAVNLTATATERAVSVAGPAKTSTGVRNTFLVSLDGVRLDDSVTVTVSVDGETVEQRAVTGGSFEVAETFETTGSHRVTARIESDDRFDRNDVARKTVRVVEPPRILYVARGDYPLEGFLGQVYDVDRARSLPEDVSDYYAIVVQDVAADDLGNVASLQRAVIDGTGLVTVGGRNSFEAGDYRESLLVDMLPVSIGEGGRTARVALAVDISGSTRGTLSVQQALALDALDQLGDENRVGLVGFNQQPYAIAGLSLLGNNREALATQIRRLQSGGGTDVAAGIDGAAEMLGEGGGTVILISDGRDDGGAPATAARVAEEGVRVITVGVGGIVDDEYLRRTANAGGGTYLSADETNRLRIRFGGESREYEGTGLTVVDDDHFITSGVQFESNPGQSNVVAAEERADFLVAGPSGAPAITAWRYGLGRTVAITAYGPDGTLDGLLSRPDSLGVTKAVNWVIGDPERLETGVANVDGARVGSPTTVTYEGDERPSANGVRFSRVGPREYRATFVPESPGYASVLGAEYAVNYPAEYADFGIAPGLRDAVDRTGGRVYESAQAATIAQEVRQRATQIRTVRTDWTWLALLVALLAYVAETSARRLTRIRT